MTGPASASDTGRRRAAGWPHLNALVGAEVPGEDRSRAMQELCHDLRQPVATIAAVVAAVEVETEVSPALRVRLAQISAETRMISELCQQALGETSDSGPVRLDAMAAEVVQAARLSGRATITMQASPAVVEGNHGALRRAVGNLLDNALEAAGPRGHVTLDVTRNEHEVVLVIADSGPGFGRVQTGRTGLGLEIAGRIATDHGGRVVVGGSEALGGAAVSIILPLVEIGA